MTTGHRPVRLDEAGGIVVRLFVAKLLVVSQFVAKVLVVSLLAMFRLRPAEEDASPERERLGQHGGCGGAAGLREEGVEGRGEERGQEHARDGPAPGARLRQHGADRPHCRQALPLALAVLEPRPPQPPPAVRPEHSVAQRQRLRWRGRVAPQSEP